MLSLPFLWALPKRFPQRVATPSQLLPNNFVAKDKGKGKAPTPWRWIGSGWLHAY